MKRLIVIAGPTAVGKTAHAVQLAQQLHTEVVSCDSRQFYREMHIGVARPTDEELAAVPHHFIACRSVTEPYNIFDYEQDALRVIDRLFETHENVIAVGGSGLYIDALLHGVSPMPDPTPELRARLQQMPLEEKRAQLKLLDPDYYIHVDLRNPVRLQRALEVCLMTGRPYSEVIADQPRTERPFETEVRVLSLSASDLRQRIDCRVDMMMQEGLLDEVQSLLPYRQLNTLNTVGYRELFPVLDGTASLDEAVAAIKLNTWHYARKQRTWFKRYC
ncbi:MAG: tRNA (adenosine(37)-N6)-dimethylallyltransferase MiaA [Bacteroidales bacterium]|nr:tRNA (adenosine(37)-N6)-dimethylallyltransferase MiaA [Bacteroidales bacterium]MBR4773501.1 tRNA (adenosine(37)-N6)-dimethylallyltransferase MiaA [Bacteroidales bacterium]